VARNRKRRNDRRPRRPTGGADTRPGVATANGQPPDDGAKDDEETPEAIEHATPDVELAEAQMAVGRPDQPADEAELEEAETEALDGTQSLADSDYDGIDSEDGDVDEPGPRRSREVAAPRGGNRLFHFLQGSWRELQRVQWPDRRQVMQATGVVIGFVIVAGVFLGVADWAATKIVHFILD
jgi:preprotein translocase subunit SecE